VSGTAAERLSRLLALVPWLVRHDGVTLAQCAEHFDVSEAQLQDDLNLLIVCGLPGYGPDQLVDIQFWDDTFEIHVDERIHVLDPQTLSRPLRLSQGEALTLLVALRMLAQLPGVGSRDAILSAATKLERAAQAEGTSRVVSVQVVIDPEVRAAIDVALADGRQLEVVYASSTKDEVTERTIDPLRLLTVDGVSYLEAFCHSAEAVRTFRVDRVISARTGAAIDPTTVRMADVEPARPDRAPAVLDVAPSARWLIDVHQATVLGEAADGSARVRLPLLSVDWGVRLVLSLAGSAVALEPPELVAAVAGASDAALAAYSDRVR
jgi:proteasome accessory factor C